MIPAPSCCPFCVKTILKPLGSLLAEPRWGCELCGAIFMVIKPPYIPKAPT